MKKYDIIMSLVNLASNLVDPKNKKSIQVLIRESGYESLDKVDLALELEAVLLKDRSLIMDWLNWSENKRTDKGWFIKNENHRYLVGYFNGAVISKSIIYSSESEACATFILNEINSILN